MKIFLLPLIRLPLRTRRLPDDEAHFSRHSTKGFGVLVLFAVAFMGSSTWALALDPLPIVPSRLDVKEREPSPSAKGAVYEWTSKGGLRYQYRIPKSYDPKQGASITFLLHGSNMDRRWGFANHNADRFRPDDIVVSPDGTTSNGQGGFNSLGQKKDAAAFHELMEELKSTFEIDATYLYGHSQGSFFALYYAGQYPDEVNGVVGHASGVWTQTNQGKKGHHQAIVLMHGTADPVVPYGQSVGGYESYVDKKYPMIRLRSLEGWNHWPSEENLGVHGDVIRHTSQQLAWCEGMTSENPKRVESALDFLTTVKSKERHDYAAAYQVASRVAQWKDASDSLKKDASRAVERIEELAEKHAAAASLPKKVALDGKAWAGHAPMFLRAFQGVPTCEELRGEYKKVMAAQDKAATKLFRSYWTALNKGDDKDAFKEGVAAMQKCYLTSSCANTEFLSGMKAMEEKAKSLKLDKKSLSVWRSSIAKFEKSREAGAKAFDGLNRKVKSLR